MYWFISARKLHSIREKDSLKFPLIPGKIGISWNAQQHFGQVSLQDNIKILRGQPHSHKHKSKIWVLRDEDINKNKYRGFHCNKSC